MSESPLNHVMRHVLLNNCPNGTNISLVDRPLDFHGQSVVSQPGWRPLKTYQVGYSAAYNMRIAFQGHV
jgi:hypothetical protein